MANRDLNIIYLEMPLCLFEAMAWYYNKWCSLKEYFPDVICNLDKGKYI